MTIAKVISQKLNYNEKQISQVLALTDAGNTVPFIARYRKEMTGNLDEVAIREIIEKANAYLELSKRKTAILASIEKQDMLTIALANKIKGIDNLQKLEDVYLPYKPKKQTRAMLARQNGLTDLATCLSKLDEQQIKKMTSQFVNKQVKTSAEALGGAQAIVAELVSESEQIREYVRHFIENKGQLITTLKKNAAQFDEKQIFKTYYQFEHNINQLQNYQILAINRGESEKILSVKISLADDIIVNWIINILKKTPQPSQYFQEAVKDGYQRLLKPVLERQIRSQLTERAQTAASKIFGSNLYHLLMQAPLKGQVIMGFDPGYRTGCKLAIIDAQGKFLDKEVIYPHKPASATKQKTASAIFNALIKKYQVKLIAIGNGTASRESVEFVVAQGLHKVAYAIVNEAGASVYSASDIARSEFPQLHVEERSAISIARRLQDPLAELIKIDPKAIGVGQYQHDINGKILDQEVDTVIERAVNEVGINVNTASEPLLQHISGLNKTTAHNIVSFRNTQGPFTKRSDLKSVPRLGPKAYQQAIGFLRIIEGQEPLDNTDIHPESYKLATQLLAIGATEIDPTDDIKINKLAMQYQVNPLTVVDVIKGLQQAGRDIRDTLPGALLRNDVLEINDLKQGMQLEGTVRNVTDFGAFIDLGVKQDGLIHISELSEKRVKHPSEILNVGQIITVRVKNVDIDRQRIELSLKLGV